MLFEIRYLRCVLVCALSAACVSVHKPGFMGAAPERELVDVVAVAQSRAAAGAFDSADSLLGSFALRYPGTVEALETTYWRGLFKLDPSNRSTSVQAALASLDGYLADSRPRMHVAEATTIRRAAAQIDVLNKAAVNASSQAKDAKAVAADAKADAKAADAATADAKDIEIKRLKDELAKANAELDRIRKRLSTPPPKT